MISVCERVENVVGKGENAGNQGLKQPYKSPTSFLSLDEK